MRNVNRILLVLALGALGCDGGRTDPDAGSPTDSGMMGTDSGMRVDAGPVTDGNDSFATATALASDPAMGRINPAGDLDYYQFTGTAGQWVIISTEANAEDDPDMLDTVVTLYDASMNRIAENDDGVPRVNTDSELVTRLPANGTYYVLVQEFSSWDAGGTPMGSLDFTYELTVAGLNAEAEAVTVDAEPGNLAEDAQELGFSVGTNGDFGLVAGVLDPSTDVDVFAITGAAARQFFQATLMPVGPTGYGSTRMPSRMWLTNADGSVTLAEIDPAAHAATMRDVELAPTMPTGDYRLWIEHGGAAGANDFYVMKLYRLMENPAESTATEATNNVLATPDAITLTDDEGVMRGYVLATLGDGDIDHFSFSATAGQAITVACGSRSSGSGVTDLEVTLLDTAGTELASDTETAVEGALIDEHVAAAAGTFVVRLTKTGQSATVTGNFVRCGVAVGAPSAG